MNHEDYIKKRDEILERSIGYALFWGDGVGGSEEDADYTPEVAAQAIDALVLAARLDELEHAAKHVGVSDPYYQHEIDDWFNERTKELNETE